MSTEIWWAVAGLAMVIADLIFGTFFILFIGAGALITALCIWIGIIPASDPTWQWVLFAVSSTLGLILFRKKLVNIFGRGAADKYDEHRGQKVSVTEDIPENGNGKVNYRGAQWIARSADGSAIAAGKTAVISQVDGIILEVHPE